MITTRCWERSPQYELAALEARGRPDDALAVWQLAIELDGEFVDPRYSRVFLLQRLGRDQEAAAEGEAIIGVAAQARLRGGVRMAEAGARATPPPSLGICRLASGLGQLGVGDIEWPPDRASTSGRSSSGRSGAARAA